MERRNVLKGASVLAGAAAVQGLGKSQAPEKPGPGAYAQNLKIASDFLIAWQRKDLTGIAKPLHSNVQFKGPISGGTVGKEAFLASTRGILQVFQSLDVRARFAAGNQVVAIYDFKCAEPIGVCRTAELLTFHEGLITEIEIFYDARPFEKAVKAKVV